MAKKRLVFIHGFLENASMWQPVVPRLSKKENGVSTPELPGHGKNLSLPKEISAKSYCHNILEQLDLEEEESVFIVAHSMGGYLSATLASMIPEKIRGLCFFHSKASADTQEKIADRERAIKAARENKELYVRTMLTSVFHPDNRTRCKDSLEKLIADAGKLSTEAVVAAQQVMISRPDQIATLQNRNFPLYYFLGDADPSLPLDIMKGELDQMPGAVAQIEPGIAHMGHLEHPQAAIDFIQRILRADL